MLKANVGCGWRDFGEDWIHVDGGNYSHLNGNDIYLRSFDEQFSLIYSSHLISYFNRIEIIELLKSWYSKLKKGGVLRIATPDHEAMSWLYAKGVHLNYFLGPMYGKMQMGNETIYHKTIYDFVSLKELLESVGFILVQKYDHNLTEHAQYDDHSAAYIQGTLISLNVECIKP